MARSKPKCEYLNKQGFVGMVDAPDYSYIYETSLTKSEKWNVGDRVVLGDGREYRYSYSSAACATGQGCETTLTGYIAIATFTVAAAAGSKSCTVAAATHDALTADELANGYIAIYDGTGNDVDFRGIIGNDAADANAAFVVYLDGAISKAITTSSKAEVFKTPFASLRTSTSQVLAKMGIPATNVSAASTYFWTQTKGPCLGTPQNSVVGENGGMGLFWRYDGSLESTDTALAVTTATYDSSQYAGYCLQGSYTGNGPLIQLVS